LSRLVIGLFILCIAVAISPAWSEETPADVSPLTLPEAARLTLAQNPRLRSAPFGREAAAALLDTAALKPQWSVELQVEDFAGTGGSGVGTSETTLRLSRIFQPSANRVGRLSVASAAQGQQENALEIERLDLMTTLLRRFGSVVYQQQLLQFTQESVQVWQRAIELVQARERAGAAPIVERLRTEIRIANARLGVTSAEQELRSARLSLAKTWGEAAPTFGRVNAELCQFAELATFEAVAANLDSNPDLRRFASEQRFYEATAQLANARRRPDWRLSLGIRHIEQIDEQTLVFGVSVPLGAKARAAPKVRRSNALRQQSQYQEQAQRLDLQAALFELYQRLVQTESLAELFATEILPRAKTIREEVAQGYRVGRFTHLELMSAQAEFLTARATRLAACNDY